MKIFERSLGSDISTIRRELGDDFPVPPGVKAPVTL